MGFPATRHDLVVHPTDNVTTLLDEHVGRSCLVSGLPIETGVPFGHKVALRDIRVGEPVIKYGLVIGHASVDIARGAHVHVHNVR